MNREQLIASLVETVDRDGVAFANGAYVDWSVRDEGNTQTFAFDDGAGGTAIFELTRDDVARLQQALTVYLIEN